jgi:hypothetical protein
MEEYGAEMVGTVGSTNFDGECIGIGRVKRDGQLKKKKRSIQVIYYR